MNTISGQMNSVTVLIAVMNAKVTAPPPIDIHAARMELAPIDHSAALMNLRCREGVRKSRYGLAFGLGCGVAMVGLELGPMVVPS